MHRQLPELTAFIITLCMSAPSYAAVDMFLGIFSNDGVTSVVSGEAQDATHQGEIDILAWHWKSTSQDGATCIEGLSMTKYIDLASAELLMSQLEGRTYPLGRLIVRKAGGTPIEYLTLEFSNLRVVMIESGGDSNQDRLVEVIHFSFDALSYTYLPQTSSGQAGTPVVASANSSLKFNC